MIDLMDLTTEKRNKATSGLDKLSVLEALQQMNFEDQKVALAVNKVLPKIEPVIREVISSFEAGGRLIYLGAGTSGRLGVFDAAECVPTFGVPETQVVGLIAGGANALTQAVAGAEDDEKLAQKDLAQLSLTANDLVLGISASGRTPYVISGLKYAHDLGAKTASLACNLDAKLSRYAEHAIEVDCGPEFLTGSTRLKAGTAQKLILNMISTIAMSGIGKVYHNLMVDVRPTNEKLVERSKRIIMQATDCTYEVAEKTLRLAGQNVKLAIVMLLTNCSAKEGSVKLQQANGFVGRTLA